MYINPWIAAAVKPSAPHEMRWLGTQANTLGAKVRKGGKSAIVVYYGQGQKRGDRPEEADDDDSDAPRAFRFQKSYRVFNAEQIEALPDRFHPEPTALPAHAPHAPVTHMQAFFEAIDITTIFTGREAYYMPAVDKVHMPEITLFEDPRSFYGVCAAGVSQPREDRRSVS